MKILRLAGPWEKWKNRSSLGPSLPRMDFPFSTSLGCEGKRSEKLEDSRLTHSHLRVSFEPKSSLKFQKSSKTLLQSPRLCITSRTFPPESIFCAFKTIWGRRSLRGVWLQMNNCFLYFSPLHSTPCLFINRLKAYSERRARHNCNPPSEFVPCRPFPLDGAFVISIPISTETKKKLFSWKRRGTT